jgi:hypothetical protein
MICYFLARKKKGWTVKKHLDVKPSSFEASSSWLALEMAETASTVESIMQQPMNIRHVGHQGHHDKPGK